MSDTRSGPGTAGASQTAVCGVGPELGEALRAQGPAGERALDLLLDAASILNHPDRLRRPYEVAQSCLRGALDSVLNNIAGEDFPGPRRARQAVVEAAGAVADSWGRHQQVTQVDLDALLDAVGELRAQQAHRGGFRARQVGQLVFDQTRLEMGLAERAAARTTWGAFYETASGVLHGSGSGADETRRQFDGVVAAMEGVFLELPERVDRLRVLARLASPVARDADEVASMTDPRAGAYFFRAAVSGRWLDLLPLERLLPEQRRWPAAPYLLRLLAEEPQRLCTWVNRHLDAIDEQGPGARAQAIALVSAARMEACALVVTMVRRWPQRDILVRAGDWARDVPPAERDGQWVQVLEHILKGREFTAREVWESGHLLRILISTAHPGGRLRTGADRLGVIIRFALAGVLGDYLGDDEEHWDLETSNDLREVTLDNPPYAVKLTLVRAVLDLALAEAELAVPVAQRLRAVHSKLAESPLRARLAAVHLTESFPHDSRRSDAEAAWWDTAITTAGRVGGAALPSADIADFIALLEAHCPEGRRTSLETALTITLGTPPAPDEIAAWRAADPTTVPSAWRIARALSPVLPAPVRAPWREVLQALEDQYGPPPQRPQPAVRITSWTESHGGLSAAAFAAHAGTDGPTAAVAELARTPVSRENDDEADEARAGLLGELVAQDPNTWAAGPGAVAAAAARPVLQAAYFNALHLAAGQALLDAALLAPVVQAAFVVRPPAQDRTPGAEALQRVITNLLHRLWDTGGSLPQAEPDAVAWLQRLVTGWTMPRRSSPSPVIDAVQTPGGSALLSLTAWGVQQAARTDSGLPEESTHILQALLSADADDQALAVIGFCLRQLHHADPRWTAAHAGPLLALDAPWRPARSWLTRGRPDHALLARLDRTGLWDALCAPQAEGALDKTFLALLDDTTPLGPAGTFLTGLADRPGGPEAVSVLLSRLATFIARLDQPGPWPGRAATVWRAALDARLPARALHGAGRFAYADTLGENTWLELTARTVLQQPALEAPYRVAERAARTPSSPSAPLIAAAALATDPADGFHHAETIRHAADLLARLPASDTAGHETLQRALINAGAIEDAYGEQPRSPAHP
ncbi:hypothetical protein ABZX85_17400 [Streptomyces sp. NPDC004539]|uniref:hypothetical protein n=1 Tax=Streptomyces sp. NPDC004539 TaxID=3154280 RepID=UPI0033AE254A